MKRDALMYSVFILIVLFFVAYGTILAQEAERRAEVEEWDLKNLRYATGFVTDSSRDFLKIPEYYQGKASFLHSFTITRN